MTRLSEFLPAARPLLPGAVLLGFISLSVLGFSYSTHRLSDFAGYYTASKILATEPASLNRLYNDAWFVQQAHRFGVEDSTFVMYVNPPSVSFLMIPVQWLDPVTAKLVWNSISLLLLGVASVLALRYFGLSFASTPGVVLLGLLTCTIPFLRNLQRGQVYILMLVLVLILLTGIQRRAIWMTAIPLAVLILLKYFGWLFLVYLAVRRRWKEVGATLGALAVGIAFCMLVLGVSTFTAHLETLTKAVQNHDFAFTGLPSMQALFGALFTANARWNPHPVADAPWIASALSIVALAGALYMMSRGSSSNVRRETNMLLVLSVIFTPLAADHHYILLVPPIVMLLHETEGGGFGRPLALAGVAYLVMGWYPAFPLREYDGWEKVVCFVRLYGAIGLWWMLKVRKQLRSSQ